MTDTEKIDFAYKLGRIAGLEDRSHRITNDHPETAYRLRSGKLAELDAYHKGYHETNNTLMDVDLV